MSGQGLRLRIAILASMRQQGCLDRCDSLFGGCAGCVAIPVYGQICPDSLFPIQVHCRSKRFVVDVLAMHSA